jgi:hypothetical protein
MNFTSKASFFFFFCASPALGAVQHFEHLIHCQDDLGFDSYCKASTGFLAEANPYHSTFFVTYRMSCDPGITEPRPSALKLVIHTENGQKNERTIQFKSVETFEPIDGFGPIELIDTRPSELNSKHYQKGCNLSVSIDSSKSLRTLQEEQQKIEVINRFLSHAEKTANDEFRLMMIFRADIMRASRDKALACLISKSENDTIYHDLISELKATYRLIFGEEYSIHACDTSQLLQEIADDCPSDSASQICAYKQAYFKSRKKVEDLTETLQSYLTDPGNSSFYERIQAFSNRIRTQLESHESGSI